MARFGHSSASWKTKKKSSVWRSLVAIKTTQEIPIARFFLLSLKTSLFICLFFVCVKKKKKSVASLREGVLKRKEPSLRGMTSTSTDGFDLRVTPKHFSIP